jgi:hypothetical protein
MQARQHEVEHLAAREAVGLAEQMQCRQAPIQPVEPQVLGQPVLQLVFPLFPGQPRERGAGASSIALGTHCVETLDVADMLVDEEL